MSALRSVRAAAVTGGSRGIGFETARALVAAGARVALLARGEAELRAAADEFGDAVLPLPTDVADAASLAASFARIGEAFGRLDALVCNAAVASPSRLEDAEPAELRRQVETNLLGPMLCTQPAFEAWTEGGFISSGGLLEPDGVAQGIVHVLTRPPGSEVRVLDLRPTPKG